MGRNTRVCEIYQNKITMKKTLSINLNGVAFNIDEDAYTTLQSYLNDLGSHFSSSEESEILKIGRAHV